jgi:hypothetical protein
LLPALSSELPHETTTRGINAMRLKYFIGEYIGEYIGGCLGRSDCACKCASALYNFLSKPLAL